MLLSAMFEVRFVVAKILCDTRKTLQNCRVNLLRLNTPFLEAIKYKYFMSNYQLIYTINCIQKCAII